MILTQLKEKVWTTNGSVRWKTFILTHVPLDLFSLCYLGVSLNWTDFNLWTVHVAAHMIDHVTTKSHVDVQGLCHSLNLCLCPWIVLPMWTYWREWLVLPPRPWWCLGSYSRRRPCLVYVPTMAECHVDDCGLYWHQRACWCPGYMLTPEIMRMSVVPVVSRTMYRSMIHVSTNCNGQGNYICHHIDGYRFTVEKEEHRRLLWQPLHLPHCTSPKHNSLDRKSPKKTLENCDKDAEV